MYKEREMDKTEGSKRPFYLRPDVIGAVIGALVGYIYYATIGCSSGSCGITSNPWFSMAWGGVMGYLIGDFFSKKPMKKNTSSSENETVT